MRNSEQFKIVCTSHLQNSLAYRMFVNYVLNSKTRTGFVQPCKYNVLYTLYT